MPSRRQERANEIIRRQVSETILYGLKDPRISFVTVTRVETAPDFTSAKVYVSVMGEPEKQQETMRTLRRAGRFIQSQVAPLLKTRNIPILNFVLDQSVKKSIRISQLLREAMAETPPQEQAEDAGDDEEPQPPESDQLPPRDSP